MVKDWLSEHGRVSLALQHHATSLGGVGMCSLQTEGESVFVDDTIPYRSTTCQGMLSFQQ